MYELNIVCQLIWLLRRFADPGDFFPDEDHALPLVKPHEVGGLMRISLLDQQTCVTTKLFDRSH
jgi:hypothetical protein